MHSDRLRVRQYWEFGRAFYRLTYRGKSWALASDDTLNGWITRLLRIIHT